MKPSIPHKPALLYRAIAVIYTFTSRYAPYPFSPLLKALPIIFLIYLASQNLQSKMRTLCITALSFSALGDVLLALEFEHNFIAGLGSFLVAHVFYIIILGHHLNRIFQKLKLLICVLVAIFLAVMASFVLPDDSTLRAAVLIYMGVITVMCWSSIWSGQKDRWLQISGGLIFAISDSIIAWDAFRSSIPYASIWIMATYYSAQAMLFYGICQLRANAPHEKQHKADTSALE